MKRKLIAVLVMTCLLFVTFGGAQEKLRVEKDLLGEIHISADAFYRGQMQLHAYEPLAGIAVMESPHLLHSCSTILRTKCIDGITFNEKILTRYMETTVGIVTALNPVLGYEKATELANEAYQSGKGILEIIRDKKILTEAQKGCWIR